MSNYIHPSIFYTVSCNNIAFDDSISWHIGHEKNLGRAFTTLYKGGGTAFLANTRNGDRSSDDIFVFFGRQLQEGNCNLGVAMAISREKKNSSYLNYSHNLVGCPEMEMWTDLPSSFMAGTYPRILKQASNIMVLLGQDHSDVKICVMSASDNGETYHQVQGIDGMSYAYFFNVPQSYLITITKQNYIPFVISDNTYVQNTEYSTASTQTVTGYNIYAGAEVIANQLDGDVIVNNGANVIFQAENNVTLHNGFEVKSGATFEVKIQH